jgi:hypothetical protein
MDNTQLMKYWHPRLGGWYFGHIQNLDIDDDGQGVYTIACLNNSTIKVAEEDVHLAVF